MLDCDEDATDKDENLSWQDDSTVVSGSFQEFGRDAIDREEGNQFFHPDERRNHKDEQRKPECVEHVAEELPASLFVACDFVARENWDEDNRQESGTDYVIQDVRNHER